MSYIGYDIDAMNAVPAIATACETTPAAIGWGLPQMWLHCLRTKDDIVTDRHLLGFFGRGRDLGQTLETFGFLEAADGGWRVRGAEARLRINQRRSEAGKKGRQKQLAGQVPSKRRASAQHMPSKPANLETTEKADEDGQQSGSRAHAQQVPSTCPASAQHMPSSGPGLPSTSPGKTAENDVLPGQKRALTPSTMISLSSSNPEREPSRAREAPRPPPVTWPGPNSPLAAQRFERGLLEHGHLGGPPATVTPATLSELAREFGDEAFMAACDDALRVGAPWPGWRVRDPLSWLRKDCDKARFRLANEKAKKPTRPPSYAELDGDTAPPVHLNAKGLPMSYEELEAAGIEYEPNQHLRGGA